MADATNTAAPLSGPQLQRAVLARLRFEQAMGVECVAAIAPVPVSRTHAAPVPAPAAPRPAPPAPPQTLPPVPQSGAELLTPSIAATPPSADVAARWKALEARAMACVACGLHAGRTNVVFGCGNRNAKLVFVGEGPGFDEDQQGIPFVGRAGQLLNKIIGAMGLKREEVYICNVVKCRPPENRTPLPDEIGACSGYLFEQIELIAPKVIVTLGAPATKTLLKVSQGIMSIRGKWYSFRGVPVMPTYHPAFVLRRYTEEVRRAVWEDMKLVMARLKEQ
jgi:DNA polymerase